ncbi:MAG: response regulator [Lachnospiraceae bacterium]|nr:response regulator [Lachnospiraceae bacterium]
MEKRIKYFLRGSFVLVIIVCAVVFLGLIHVMTRKTEDSISEISEIYMKEMNVQLRQKFYSIINLRLEQVEGIIKMVPPQDAEYGDELLDKLSSNAQIRNLVYIGFSNDKGELKEIYGKNIVSTKGGEKVLDALKKGNDIVEQGIDEDGERILLIGKEASYPMENGENSLALVVGVPMEYLNEAMFLEAGEGQIYTHVIDKEGNFIIRNVVDNKTNYFERINDTVTELNGLGKDEYLVQLRKAMEAGEDFSAEILMEGEQKYIYCSQISDNYDWYLLTVMPGDMWSDSVGKLDQTRIFIMIGSSLIILLVMGVVFLYYFRLSTQQMEALNKMRKEAERANKAKSEFLSSMSHDIRTPMNAIIGMTDIAMKNLMDTVKVEDCLKKVQLSSKHLLGLINDVLDMSKIESGKVTLNMNPLSLRDAMDDIVNIVKPQVKERNQFFDILINNIISENICCDGVRLNQILLNLLSNAIKFTPEGGRIDVHVYQEESLKGDNMVKTHFIVEDNGIGMTEEFQKKIFDTFTRDESELVQGIVGTGLGMSITKRVTELMGGTIELESKLNVGSKFHITLELERAKFSEDMKLPDWQILVVDDNQLLCESAVANLEVLGVRAEWTQDGNRAVEMIEERHKRDDDYQFVLIDWKMPRMDGMQTIRRIREKVGKKIPIFLISAYDWSDIEEDAKEADVEGFISKPLFSSTLYACLSRYAEEHDTVSSKENDSQQMDFTGKRILVAEDNDINWEIADEILSSFGFVLERAVNGKECVDKFNSSQLRYYDLILMDIRMPVMNGYEATKAIRALTARNDNDLPIIAMTADAFSDDVQVCLECGMDAHAAKPLDIMVLLNLISKFLK